MVEAECQKRQREYEHNAERAQEVPQWLRQFAPGRPHQMRFLSGDGFAGHGPNIG